MFVCVIKNEFGEYRNNCYYWSKQISICGKTLYRTMFYDNRNTAEEIAAHIEKTEKVKCEVIVVEIKEVDNEKTICNKANATKQGRHS